MEESKLVALYDELTKKGGAAAKFKQGLGFSDSYSISADGSVSVKGSALPSSSSSFLTSFVKSSTANTTDSDVQHQSELHSIKNKLSKKPLSKPRVSDRNDNLESNVKDRDRDVRSRRRSRSRSRSRSIDRKTRRRSRSRSRSRDRKSRRRSRSRSRDSKSSYRHRSSSRERERRRRRSKSRSLSPPPRERRRESNNNKGGSSRGVKEKTAKVDYARLIPGYDKMSPAERVKAKMKLQLTETAEKDVTNGTRSGWERFDFNKDAPLDDEEIEAAEDDAKLVKHIGQSFRFSAVEARKEEQIKAAHDNAMFGAPNAQISIATIHKAEEEDSNKIESSKTDVTSLMSEKVLAKPQGSWRDRVRKV